MFERMVNNRATTKAQMTDAQAGGQKRPSHCRPPPCLQRSSQRGQNTKNACLGHLSRCNQGLRQSMDRRHNICHVQKRSKLKTLENH